MMAFAEIHLVSGTEYQAKERHCFIGDNLSGLFLPVRIGPRIFAQMAGYGLDPFRLNGCNRQSIEFGCLDKRCGNDPLPALHELVRSGKDRQFPVMGTLIQIAEFFPCQVAQKTGEERPMNLLIGGVDSIVCEPFPALKNSLELIMQVNPFAHPLERKILALAIFFQSRPGFHRIMHIVERIPNIQQGHEVGVGMQKCFMHFVSLFFMINRADTRILDGQDGGNDFDFPQAIVALCLNDDPGNTRINRQISHDPAPLGQVSPVVYRPQFTEQLISLFDGAFMGRVKKWKILGMAKLQRDHLENDIGEV